MDNLAGCPRGHAQAVGCPQAPQGATTTTQINKQANSPRSAQALYLPSADKRSHPPPESADHLHPSARNAAAPHPYRSRSPKSPVTFAEIRTERRAIERNEAAVLAWKRKTWPALKKSVPPSGE